MVSIPHYPPLPVPAMPTVPVSQSPIAHLAGKGSLRLSSMDLKQVTLGQSYAQVSVLAPIETPNCSPLHAINCSRQDSLVSERDTSRTPLTYSFQINTSCKGRKTRITNCPGHPQRFGVQW